MNLSENLPIPSNYILGPGDELVISLWGQTQLRESYTISREGKIYDEKVGLLNLNGRTIEQARAYLKNQFGRVYSTLNGKNPSAYIDVSLGDLRSINVNFVGNLNYPGIYPIHPFSTVITGLIQAGGIDTLGSLRNIEITDPYMHDGSMATLEDVIAHYSAGGQGHYLQDNSIVPFQLSKKEEKQLMAFLKSLTDLSFLERL